MDFILKTRLLKGFLINKKYLNNTDGLINSRLRLDCNTNIIFKYLDPFPASFPIFNNKNNEKLAGCGNQTNTPPISFTTGRSYV